MNKLLALVVMIPALALGQSAGLQAYGGGGKVLASFPFTGNGATIAEDANTVAHVIFNPAVTNYALQSNSMSSGSAAVSPWATTGGTIATVAGAEPGGTWVAFTNSTATHGIYQGVTTPSSSSFVASAWMRKASGTGDASIMAGCAVGGTVAASACSCLRSDGGACTGTVAGNYCIASVANLGATPVRLSAILTCSSAQLGVQVWGFGGIYPSTTGTTYFSGYQAEAGVIRPSDLVVTTTDPVTVRPVNTNYVLLSNAMTIGSVGNNWTLDNATATTIAGAPSYVGGGSWSEVTSTTLAGNVYNFSATPSSNKFTGSIWMAKASGTGPASLGVGCWAVGSPTSCSCTRSDGTACSSRTLGVNCVADIPDLGTNPLRVSVTATCGSSITNPNLWASPGRYNDSLGTTRFTGAMLDVKDVSDLIPTNGTAVQVDRALVDTKGNLWAMAGTVPQVQSMPSPFYPGKAGAGPFSDANYYSLGAGSDVLDFSGDFTACAVLTLTGAPGTDVFFNNKDAAGTQGYYLGVTATDIRVSFSGGVIGSVAVPVVGPNVACFGRASGTWYAKTNLAATVSQAAALTPASTTVATIGRFVSAGNAATKESLHELYFTSTPWNEANVTAIQQRVLGHYDGSTPISVTRTTPATYLGNDGATLYTAAPGVARITSDGLLVEPARTNYALQSNTMSTATAATSPWALANATVATVAGAPVSGTWAEVTSTNNSGSISQSMTSASSTTFVASAWAAKASGTGYAQVSAGCGNVPTACTCVRSDGGACTAANHDTNFCGATVSDLGTTPVRVSAITTCTTATTAPSQLLYPGQKGTATGTTRFSGAQLEVGTYPTSLIVTAGTSVARNADQVSATVPLVARNWCVAVTAKPEWNRSWFTTGTTEGLWTLGDTGSEGAGSYVTVGNWVGLTVRNPGGSRYTLQSAGVIPAGQHRIVSCAAPPNVSVTMDGSTYSVNQDVGTAIFSTTPTTFRIGSLNNIDPFGGFIKNLKLCNAKSPKDCK